MGRSIVTLGWRFGSPGSKACARSYEKAQQISVDSILVRHRKAVRSSRIDLLQAADQLVRPAFSPCAGI